MKFVPDTTQFQSEPKTDFNFIVEKQTAFFENRSKFALAHHWRFGDGEFSNDVNPRHNYTPGKYTVTLETSSGCGFDSQTKEVEVSGLHKISPAIAPATGFTVFRLYGYGWDNQAKVTLKNSAATIQATISFFDPVTQSLQANFRFQNAPTGFYDVIVSDFNCPDNRVPCGDTLRLAVELQIGKTGEPWVQIDGPSQVRPDPAGRRAF